MASQSRQPADLGRSPLRDFLFAEFKMTNTQRLTDFETSVRKTVSTNAGSIFLWDQNSFGSITDYGSWAEQLEDEPDIRAHIEAGRIVPVSWGGDSASEVVARLGAPSRMSDREKQYLLVPSQPYRFKTTGKVCISGIEMISGKPDDHVLTFEIPPGTYAVYLNMIAWMDEPGAENADGSPAANALPDFIVCLDRPNTELGYRIEPEPYRKEDAQR